MQVMIGAIRAFTDKCVVGIQANPEKAALWLEENAIIVTALNPLIGYGAGARLVKEALSSGCTVRQLAIEQAAAGQLRHQTEDRLLTTAEVEQALSNILRLTEGGLAAGGVSGG
jgi:fumarate hydratase class II